MPRLREHDAAVGVLDVAQQMFITSSVIQPHDRSADQRGATERKEVVGGVVEQHRHMTRSLGRQPLVEQCGEAA